MIEAAAEQMTGLLDELGVAARDRGRPLRARAPGGGHARARARTTIRAWRCAARARRSRPTPRRCRRALAALALAAIRHGPVERVAWTVDGRALTLAPVTSAAGPVVSGEELRDLGSLVAAPVVEALGGSLELDGQTLRVAL